LVTHIVPVGYSGLVHATVLLFFLFVRWLLRSFCLRLSVVLDTVPLWIGSIMRQFTAVQVHAVILPVVFSVILFLCRRCHCCAVCAANTKVLMWFFCYAVLVRYYNHWFYMRVFFFIFLMHRHGSADFLLSPLRSGFGVWFGLLLRPGCWILPSSCCTDLRFRCRFCANLRFCVQFYLLRGSTCVFAAAFLQRAAFAPRTRLPLLLATRRLHWLDAHLTQLDAAVPVGMIIAFLLLYWMHVFPQFFHTGSAACRRFAAPVAFRMRLDMPFVPVLRQLYLFASVNARLCLRRPTLVPVGCCGSRQLVVHTVGWFPGFAVVGSVVFFHWLPHFPLLVLVLLFPAITTAVRICALHRVPYDSIACCVFSVYYCSSFLVIVLPVPIFSVLFPAPVWFCWITRFPVRFFCSFVIVVVTHYYCCLPLCTVIVLRMILFCYHRCLPLTLIFSHMLPHCTLIDCRYCTLIFVTSVDFDLLGCDWLLITAPLFAIVCSVLITTACHVTVLVVHLPLRCSLRSAVTVHRLTYVVLHFGSSLFCTVVRLQ